MRLQQQLVVLELHKNVMKNNSKEMLSIDILFPLSNSFVDAVFSIIKTTDNHVRKA